MFDPSQLTPESLMAQKQAAFHGMAEEYGLTMEQAQAHFDRYDADVDKALKKYQAGLNDALRVLQANLNKTAAGARHGASRQDD